MSKTAVDDKVGDEGALLIRFPLTSSVIHSEGEVVAGVGFITGLFFFSAVVCSIVADAVNHVTFGRFLVAKRLAIERIGWEGREKIRH